MNLFRHFLWHLHLRVVPPDVLYFSLFYGSFQFQLSWAWWDDYFPTKSADGRTWQFYISLSIYQLAGSMPSNKQYNHRRKLWHTRHDWTVGCSIYNNFDQTWTRPYYITTWWYLYLYFLNHYCGWINGWGELIELSWIKGPLTVEDNLCIDLRYLFILSLFVV